MGHITSASTNAAGNIAFRSEKSLRLALEAFSLRAWRRSQFLLNMRTATMHDLVTSYDRHERSTVKDYFPENDKTLAYQAIKRLGIEACGRYRPPHKKTGKGAALYWLRDLKKVSDDLTRRSESLVIELPDGTLDLATVEQIYGLSRALCGQLFSYVGLEPVGMYNRNGSRRASKLFTVHDVDVLFRALERCKQSFADQDEPESLASMPTNSTEAENERSHK